MTKNERFFPLLGAAAIWGAAIVPITIAGIMVGLDKRSSTEGVVFSSILPWVFLVTAVPSVVLSVIGAVWLGVIGINCVQTHRLAASGILVGAVLSLPFSVLGLLTSHGDFNGIESFILSAMAIGAVNGLAFALVFQRWLLLKPAGTARFEVR